MYEEEEEEEEEEVYEEEEEEENDEEESSEASSVIVEIASRPGTAIHRRRRVRLLSAVIMRMTITVAMTWNLSQTFERCLVTGEANGEL